MAITFQKALESMQEYGVDGNVLEHELWYGVVSKMQSAASLGSKKDKDEAVANALEFGEKHRGDNVVADRWIAHLKEVQPA